MNKPTTSPGPTVEANTSYENNPFFVATKGLEELFKYAKPVAVAFVILSVASVLSSIPSVLSPAPAVPTQTESPKTPDGATTPGVANEFDPLGSLSSIPLEVIIAVTVFVLFVLLIISFFTLVINGVSDYTSAAVAKGKTVTFTGAFRGFFSHFWGYVWVQVIAMFKIFAWSLLLIIPGIIMSFRYILAGTSYFDDPVKNKGGRAIKHSLALTKNAWLTTVASHALFNLITFGMIQPLLNPGTNAVLYRQFTESPTKPKAHILSWLTLIIPIILGVLFIMALVAVINYALTQQSTGP